MSNEHLAPIDTNVRIPDNVAAAGSAADELHKRIYSQQPEPTADVTATVSPEAAAAAAADEAARNEEAARAEQSRLAAEGQTHVVPAPAPAGQDDFSGPADAQSLKDSEWARRYNSMKGRYDALTRSYGAQEEQMRQLASELVRTQNIVASLQQAQPTPQTSNHVNVNPEDVENYGEELINTVARTARAAVEPELNALREENAKLAREQKTTARQRLFAKMDQDLPSWRQLNVDPRFKAWLRLPNVYTGTARGEALNSAVNGANAPAAIQIFRDFLTEAQATGLLAPAQQDEPQPAPRTPAVALESLAAPGRARPAPGDSQVPAEKPTYSRAQISQFYDEKRRGLWANRLAEADKIEADMIAAQSQGRIRN